MEIDFSVLFLPFEFTTNEFFYIIIPTNGKSFLKCEDKFLDLFFYHRRRINRRCIIQWLYFFCIVYIVRLHVYKILFFGLEILSTCGRIYVQPGRGHTLLFEDFLFHRILFIRCRPDLQVTWCIYLHLSYPLGRLFRHRVLFESNHLLDSSWLIDVVLYHLWQVSGCRNNQYRYTDSILVLPVVLWIVHLSSCKKKHLSPIAILFFGMSFIYLLSYFVFFHFVQFFIYWCFPSQSFLWVGMETMVLCGPSHIICALGCYLNCFVM